MFLRIIKLAIASLYHVFARPFAGLGRKDRPECVVLCYHAVRESDRGRFARQLDFLARRRKVVPVGYSGPMDPRTRYTMITMDDAFRCVLEWAVPEYRKRGFAFSLFAPSSCMGRLPPWLADTVHPDRAETIASAAELRALPGDLAIVGSHTATHVKLSTLRPDELRQEVKCSKEELEAALGKPVDFIAFPHGDHDGKVLEACAEAGYRQAFTIEAEDPRSPADAFCKGRTVVDPSDWSLEFRLKAAGSYSWMAAASKAKRSLKRALGRA